MKSRTDMILGTVIALAGLVLLFWVIPNQIHDAGFYGLAPSFVPRILAGLMIMLGAMLALSNLGALFPAGGRARLAKAAITWRNVRHLGLILGICGAMLLIMGYVGDISTVPYVGFWVALPPAAALFTLFQGPVGVRILLINSLAAPASIYLMSWMVFAIPMP